MSPKHIMIGPIFSAIFGSMLMPFSYRRLPNSWMFTHFLKEISLYSSTKIRFIVCRWSLRSILSFDLTSPLQARNLLNAFRNGARSKCVGFLSLSSFASRPRSFFNLARAALVFFCFYFEASALFLAAARRSVVSLPQSGK